MSIQGITLTRLGQRSESESTDERHLVALAKSGESAAFGELYERHWARIYHITFRILRNPQDAEDAVQRAFQHAFTGLARFREHSTFATWVTRIAINEALMMLRQKRAHILLSADSTDNPEAPYGLTLADHGPSPEQALAQNELHSVMLRAVSGLRTKLQAVVHLREFQGLTSAETARRLGLSVAAVKGRAFHARHRLRQNLKQGSKLRTILE